MAESKIGKFVASIVELFSREIKPVGDSDIYTADSDNLYPNRIELVERNSVTAIACNNKLKSFILGKGFQNKEFNEMIVNSVKNMKGYEFLNLVARSLATHRGAFIHVNYDATGDVNYLDVLNYRMCRVGKKDSKDFQGKTFYADWEAKENQKLTNISQKTTKWFYPFDRKNVNPQRLANAKFDGVDQNNLESVLSNYRGQVYFLNLDKGVEVYPYAWVHSVYNDADNEYRISLYRNTNLRTGFLGKTMFIPNGLDKESMNEFDTQVRSWLGAENSSSAFVFKPEQYIEDLDNIIKTVQLESSYDPSKVEKDEVSVANNIRKAYRGIPNILIEPSEGFFGQSGEAMKEAVKYYNNETLDIREAIAYMMDLFFNGDFTIQPLGVEDLLPESEGNTEVKKEVSEETLAAQATLKGSVGGVQGILSIQQSYSTQLTTLESAVTILMEIYGFERSIAMALLGNPEIKQEEQV